MSCNNKDLDFIKLTALPPIVEPNKAYLIKENEGTFTMYMTDKDSKVYGLDPSVYTLDFNEETNILRLRNSGGVVSQVDLSSLAQAEGVVSVDVQGVTINFRDSAGDVIDSIQLGVSNIVGLQDELDEKEDLINKVTDLSSPNNLEYPTTQAVYDAIQGFVPDLTDYVSYNPQSKPDPQKQQARTNIGVYSTQEIQDFLDGTTPINGYNKSNWDEAFGWGNHASAGYAVLNVMNTGTLTASNLSGTNTGDQTLAGLGGEPSFTKNTAFNKNFGTSAGTVAQGNDSRINNGQTAFGWGDWSAGVTKTYVDNLGIDANTLDGLNSTDFVTITGVQNITGNKAFTNGITLPNVVDEGSIVTTSTRIPIIGIDGSVDSYTDLEDLLALNPPPPTPTLQSVTDAGNEISITDLFLYNGSELHVASPKGSQLIQSIIYGNTGLSYSTSNNGGEISFNNSPGDGTPTGIRIRKSATSPSDGTDMYLYPTETTERPGVRFAKQGTPLNRRVAIASAINNDEAVTLGQMLDSIGVYSLTEGANTGYATKFRRDNPNFYGGIGNLAIDLSINDLSSDTRGATGASSVAIGYRSTASGGRSTVVGGSGGLSSGYTSIVLGGSNNNATDTYTAIVGGLNNTSTKQSAVVIGGQNNASSGNQSAIIGGVSNTTTGSYSVSIGGSTNEATGIRSVTISGNNSVASGNESIVLGGYNNYARSYYEVVTGYYPTDYVPTGPSTFKQSDRLFNIGNGAFSTPSDAFTILKNGETGIGIDNFEANTTGELLQVNGNIDITPPGGALLLASPDGTVYELKVDNSGALTVIPR